MKRTILVFTMSSFRAAAHPPHDSVLYFRRFVGSTGRHVAEFLKPLEYHTVIHIPKHMKRLLMIHMFLSVMGVKLIHEPEAGPKRVSFSPSHAE